MREAEEIRRGLMNMLEEESSIFQATVTAVNEKEFTCTVMEEGIVSYYNVRLRSVINPELNGIAFIPVIGSYVLVCRIGKSNELFICLFSEIDKILFNNENVALVIDNETITADIKNTNIFINGEKLNASVNSTDLLMNNDGFTIKKGNSGLKKTLNDILTALQLLTVPTGVGPSGIPVNAATFKAIQEDLNNYLEN